MTHTLEDPSRDEYLFGNDADLTVQQLWCLQVLLDGPTTSVLDSVGIGPGWRCLDLGAGSGSIARWLADRTGSPETVVAADLTTDHIGAQAGMRVMRHDINDGVPPGGPFDLIHARLLLLHLARREEILDDLVGSLAPGGWLVIGDFGARLPYALVASRADKAVFDRVQDVGHHIIGRSAGQSLTWAHEVQRHMDAAGLVNVHAREHSETIAGGSAGGLYHRNLILQLEAQALRTGITESELKRYGELMLDPRFRAWSYQFICTSGQKQDDIGAGTPMARRWIR